VLLERLEDDKQYYVKMYATTTTGKGQMSPILDFHTGEMTAGSGIYMVFLFRWLA
jgi:hypothetical protein